MHKNVEKMSINYSPNFNLKKRTKLFKSHTNFLSKFNNFFETPIQKKNVKTGWLAYPITIKTNNYFDRKDFQIYLEKNNIQTRVVFTGNILRQPAFKNIKCIKKRVYRSADKIMKNSLLIACHHGLSMKEIKYIYLTIIKFFKYKKF